LLRRLLLFLHFCDHLRIVGFKQKTSIERFRETGLTEANDGVISSFNRP
jgi:hypothetical protein